MTSIPCPECGSTNWERRTQHLVNETEMFDSTLPVSYGLNGHNPSQTDEAWLESEVLEDWYCWPNKHPATDEIGDTIADLI